MKWLPYNNLNELSKAQFGFRGSLGTKEALFAFNILAQQYGCFLDFNKAFDKVSHDRPIGFLEKKMLDKKDIRIIIYNLY